MNILLTNDDGYESGGVMLLCEKLSSMGHNVYVVAPAEQRSATSHSVNLRNEMVIRKLDNYCGAKLAYISEGSPADCVKFAVAVLGVKFDLLISGPNNGENAGNGVLYSGTVGAAEEGAICGIKSIALSRVGWFADGGSFASAVEYLADNLQQLYDACSERTIINVNVPSLPVNDIKGVKVCPLCPDCLFNDDFIKVDGKTDVWKVKGAWLGVDTTKDNDISWTSQGFVTITPITLDRTDYSAMAKLKGLKK